MSNQEGYADPTAEIAIANVVKEQMLKKKQLDKNKRCILSNTIDNTGGSATIRERKSK